MKTKTFTFFIALILITKLCFTQEKYAIILNAYAPDTFYSENSWADANPSSELYYEFWNDIYMMWEMLYERGFEDKNIFVAYAHGEDFPVANPWYNQRYKAIYHYLGSITDYRAYGTTVDSIFTGLAQGSLGFPRIQEDDFFVLYVFGHGVETGIKLEPFEPEPGPFIDWTELSDYLSAIICHKKVVIMQQCFSGACIPYLQGNNTIIMTAANDSMTSRVVDTYYYDSIDFPGDTSPGSHYDAYEREQYPGDTLSYRHAEFNLHLFNSIKRIDPAGNSTFYQTGLTNFPLSSADSNADNFTSLEEAFSWIRSFDSRMRYDSSNRWDDPQKSDMSNIMHQTSFEYPTLLHSNIGTDGLQETHRGIIGISKTIHVLPGCQLRLRANANIYLLNESKLIVDAGGTLVLEESDTIIATNAQNQIVINGNITIGENVYLTSENNTQWQGLQINNTGLSLSLQNVDFNNCGLSTRMASISLDSCDFTNGSISHTYGNILVNNAVFNNGGVGVQYANGSQNYATVQNSSFTNSANFNHALVIESYPVYTLSGLSVSGYLDNAIEISNSGYGATGNHLITENSITGNGTSSLTAAGLYIYNSYADVVDNEVISFNPYGIQCLHNSDITLTGNRNATYDYQTQQIRDNAINQVYATRGSFPREVKWNAIVDEDNTCLFKYVSAHEEVPYDVEYNYWGENFSASHDLCPTTYFDYIPLWDLQPGGAPIEGAALSYAAATSMADSGNYTQAKTAYQGVVNTWPESKYAQASLKKLFVIEPEAGNNLSALKSYFLTIDENETLKHLAGHLAAFCDVAQANWQQAIDRFEELIQYPASYQDSLFAIIDLAHTYILMEQSGFKSSAMGKLNQYAFGTAVEYENCRDHHISLLFKDGDEKVPEAIFVGFDNPGELISNAPNPFSETTEIVFALKETARVCVYVVSNLGERIELFSMPQVSEGIHKVRFQCGDLPPGVYFCALEINDRVCDTQKVVLID